MHKESKIRALAICLMVFIAVWNSSGKAQQNSQQDVNSLSQQLSKQIESRQYRESLNTIASIKSSGYDYEAEIFYFQGIAYLNIKQYSAAEAALRVYIELSGSKGQYFQDALESIDQIEIRLGNSQNFDDTESQKNMTALNDDETSVVDEIESRICEDLRIWNTSRLPGKSYKISKHYECGSHYVLEQDENRKLIWRTKERE